MLNACRPRGLQPFSKTGFDVWVLTFLVDLLTNFWTGRRERLTGHKCRGGTSSELVGIHSLCAVMHQQFRILMDSGPKEMCQ